jgi:hypothetical protein
MSKTRATETLQFKSDPGKNRFIAQPRWSIAPIRDTLPGRRNFFASLETNPRGPCRLGRVIFGCSLTSLVCSFSVNNKSLIFSIWRPDPAIFL